MRPRRLHWLFAVLVLATASVAGRGPGTAQPVVRVGVLLPLSGPLAAEGMEALRAIEAELRGARVGYVVQDDRGALFEALVAIDRLVQRERVTAIIGPITSAPTEALAMKHDPGAAVIFSLATSTRDMGMRLAKSNPSVVTFSSISREDLNALAKKIGEKGRPRRVGLVVSSSGASTYVDEIVAALGDSLPRHEAPLRALLSRPEDVVEFVTGLNRTGVDLIIGTVSEPIANELIREMRRARATASAVVFSPPSLAQRGRVAARLLAAAASGSPAPSPRQILDVIRRSSLYDESFHTVLVNWTVTNFGLQLSQDSFGTSREANPSTSRETSPCVCRSKDGMMSRRQDCLRAGECRQSEADGICQVACPSPSSR